MSEFTVTVIFHFKKDGSRDFLSLVKDPENGIALTKKWKGYKSIEFFTNKENEDEIILWERWETAEDYASYLKMRTDTGLFEKLGPHFSAPPTIIKQNAIKL